MWFIGVEVDQETSAPRPEKILDPPLFTDPCFERLARFSCSLPLSIFLFSPTHNVVHKKLILHLRAFMRSNK